MGLPTNQSLKIYEHLISESFISKVVLAIQSFKTAKSSQCQVTKSKKATESWTCAKQSAECRGESGPLSSGTCCGRYPDLVGRRVGCWCEKLCEEPCCLLWSQSSCTSSTDIIFSLIATRDFEAPLARVMLMLRTSVSIASNPSHILEAADFTCPTSHGYLWHSHCKLVGIWINRVFEAFPTFCSSWPFSAWGPALWRWWLPIFAKDWCQSSTNFCSWSQKIGNVGMNTFWCCMLDGTVFIASISSNWKKLKQVLWKWIRQAVWNSSGSPASKASWQSLWLLTSAYFPSGWQYSSA